MKNVLLAGVAVLVFACVAMTRAATNAEEIGIRAPEGFEVSLYAGDELAHDIYSMTFDSKGRVVVAGRGYVKILHDEDDDGRAEKATLFSEYPKSGAHGMVFLGNDLIATGDNLLMRLKDEDGDGKADGKPIPLSNVKSPEHGANGLVQGPDGWIYMICGNDAGVGAQFARTKTSPVKKPQAGTVVRFSPDFKTSEIFAHGFRNPYDLAFNANGHLFTVDADGERDQYLPWYAPTRLFDIQQGMHHGWVQRGWTRSWNRPEYFFDNVERLVEIGRGSPTGVECYRHYAFPKHYRGGIYSCCWTLGTVYYFPLTREGASYKSKKEIFLQTTGDVGFAPVDLAVGPNGDMFVAIGGRGTRGSVFRVRYTGELKGQEKPPEAKDGILDVLAAPQPLAAWSRAKWVPLAKESGQRKLQAATVNKVYSIPERIRAVEAVTALYGNLSYATQRALVRGRPFEELNEEFAQLRARAIWSGATASEPDAGTYDLASYAAFVDYPMLTRGAWEALAVLTPPDNVIYNRHDWVLAAHHPDRRVRSAAVQTTWDPNAFDRDLAEEKPPMAKSGLLHYRGMQGLLGPRDLVHAAWLFQYSHPPSARREDDVFNRFLFEGKTRRTMRRNAVRMMQLCLGDIRVEPSRPDVYAGYTANAPGKVLEQERLAVSKTLNAAFPTDDMDANREIARVMGMLEVEGDAVEQFAQKLTGCWNLRSSLQDDIHFLIVLSRLPGARTTAMTEKTADTLSFLHFKMLLGEMYPSRNWPLRVGEAFVELCKRDPKLAETLATHRDFGLPPHAMFAKLMPQKERKLAARRLLECAQRLGEDAQWTPEMVSVISVLINAEAYNAIRAQWSNYALRDAIVDVLTHGSRNPADKPIFIEALSESNPRTVERAAEGLWVAPTGTPEEIAAALSALRRHSDDDSGGVRLALRGAINALTEQEIAFGDEDENDVLAAYQPAFDWFARTHPEEYAKMMKLNALDGVDWEKRLKTIDWSGGDPMRGERIYQSRSCAKCHAGGNRLGPSLEGITGRWSRDDLIKEIVDPNRNVAPQFLTSRLETSSGKVYHGVPIYQSPDGTLLQTGPNETIRIAGPEVVSISKSRTSLMPTGLLRGLKDEEVADLYAYLKTLTAKPK